MSEYEKREKIIKMAYRIKLDFRNGNNKNIESDIKEFLKLKPDDYDMTLILAKVYMIQKRFDEAICEFEKVLLQYPDSPMSIRNLFFLYYYKRNYEKCYKMLIKGYDIDTIDKDYCIIMMENFIRKKLGLPVKETVKKSYLETQLLEYNEQLAILHINEHRYETELQRKSMKSVVNKNIDFNALYQVVKKNLKTAIRTPYLDPVDTYYFAYQNIGSDSENIYNALKVIVVPETTDIITMFPDNLPPFMESINVLDFMGINVYKNSDRDNSQINKFYKKYPKQKKNI